LFLVLLAVAFSSHRSSRQTTQHVGTLFETIKSLDTQLFDAYNNCDLATLGSLVSDDLEFYHDRRQVVSQ
jgi:hypothetical protein